MKLRLASLCAALALAELLAACKDSSTAPATAARAAGQTASFATAFDTGGGGGGPGQSHFVANGNSGFVNWFTSGSAATVSDTGGGGGGGFTFGQLSVSQGGSVNNPQTFLFYFIGQCDAFFFCIFKEGSGLIPNNDLSGGGQQLHLATNTSGNPNFFTFGGPPGLVMVDWRTNGAFQQRNSGTSDLIFSGFRQHTTGVSTSASANATGSVLGVVIPPGSAGNIGTNHSVTIDIFH
jgi:hypothetical protein